MKNYRVFKIFLLLTCACEHAVHKELSEIEETRKVIGKHLLQYMNPPIQKIVCKHTKETFSKYPDYTPASYAFVNNIIQNKKDSSKYSEEHTQAKSFKRGSLLYSKKIGFKTYVKALFKNKLQPKEYEPCGVPLHLIHEFSHGPLTMSGLCTQWLKIYGPNIKNYETLLEKTEDLWHSLPLPRQLFLLHLIEDVMNKEKQASSIKDFHFFSRFMFVVGILLRVGLYQHNFSHTTPSSFLMLDFSLYLFSAVFIKILGSISEKFVTNMSPTPTERLCLVFLLAVSAISLTIISTSPLTSLGLEFYNILHETPEVKNLRLLSEHFKKKLREAYI